MKRANRVTIVATEGTFEARFYRTHTYIGTIASMGDTDWTPNKDAKASENRESFRQWACEHAEDFDIEWNPDKQEQAWERKYKKYATDEQVGEDAITLMDMALTGVADKLGYEWNIAFASIYAKKTDLSYIEDGRYVKDNCWAWADIVVDVTLTDADGKSIEIPMEMELVSGQIKKCKLTQTILKTKIQVEEELSVA